MLQVKELCAERINLRHLAALEANNNKRCAHGGLDNRPDQWMPLRTARGLYGIHAARPIRRFTRPFGPQMYADTSDIIAGTRSVVFNGAGICTTS